MTPRVSVIIPTYNRRDELAACIRSIEQQTFGEREIIVVDDGSSDGTCERLSGEFAAVRVLRTPGRCGPAHARNVGLRAADGDFVLFLDSDTEFPRSDVLATVVQMLESAPTIGLVGGEIAVLSGRPDEAYGRNVTMNGESYRVAARAGRWVDCDYLATCNCGGRRSLMLKVGGFDPYYGFGAEDQDFCTRVRALGLRCVACLETAVQHKQSLRGRNVDETFRYHVTRVRYQVKLAGARRLIAGLLFDVLRAALFYLVLPVKVVVKVARRERLARENFSGGWLLVKAYAVNLVRRAETVRCRHADFLSAEETARFEAWRAQRAGT